LWEDLELFFELKICAIVLHFALKGEGELIDIGSAPQLGRLSTTPSSIILVELSIAKKFVAAE
jgi:hypothetical protein